MRRNPKHVSDLSAVVPDQAHAVDHDVVNEPVCARLRHDIVESDIRTVFGPNRRANERGAPARAHLFTDKADRRRPIPWQLASDDAEVSLQEAITEEPGELLAFDHAERTPFGLEHAARHAREIEQASRELTDFMLRLTGVGGLAENRRGLSEEVVQLLARRRARGRTRVRHEKDGNETCRRRDERAGLLHAGFPYLSELSGQPMN